VLLFGSFNWLNAIHFPDFQEMSVATQNLYNGNWEQKESSRKLNGRLIIWLQE